MLRISVPLALLLAAVIFLIGRRPRLLVPIAIVFVGWILWQQATMRRRR